MANSRTMRFAELDGGCIVCISHAVNRDGYLRKRWVESGRNVLEMFHRFIYRIHYGPIPEGFEVNHLCQTRACCNPRHLELIEVTAHRVLTNETRARQNREHRGSTICQRSTRRERPSLRPIQRRLQ